jgi:hypothetical protein
MASSVVEIANLALLDLGEALINSLSDAEISAVRANTLWPSVRKAVLRAHPWNCAIKEVALGELSTNPSLTWAYAFQLPSDCLRVLKVNDGRDDFEIMGRVLHLDGNVAEIKYVFDEEDVTKYDALLDKAMAARLAHDLTKSTTASSNEKAAQWDSYRKVVSEAKTIDSQENGQMYLTADEWDLARVQ